MKIGASLEAISGRSLDVRHPQRTLRELLASVVTVVKEHDLQVVEIPLDAAFLYPALFTPNVLSQMRLVAEENGFYFTAHLPYMWLDLSSINEKMRETSVQCVLEGLRMGEELNAIAYPLHLMGERAEAIAASSWAEEEKRDFLARMVEQAERSLEEITREVDSTKLCLENSGAMFFEPMGTMAGRHNASLCLDVGHLIVQGGDPVASIEANFQAVKEVHLHDVVTVGEAGDGPVLIDHQPLGSGIIDLKGIVRALDATAYEGVLLLEVMNNEDLLRSLAALKPLF